MLAMIARLPQPLKTLYVLYFAAFAGAFVAIVVGGRTVPVAMGVLGAVAAATGLTIATDLNGSGAALTKSMKTYRPLGVDYSRSVFARPWFSRLFGTGLLVIGIVFLVAALSQL